jgi:hypothetical protein
MTIDLNTLKPGMLIEAEIAIVGKPNRTIRVRIDRTPWPSGERSTILSDGRSVDSVLTDTIRVIPQQYRVTWEVDVFDATSPEDAARKALAIQRKPDSIATVFDVTGPDKVTHKVDLTALDGDGDH